LTLNVKQGIIGVGVTMEVNRWSFGVGRAWTFPEEGSNKM